MGKAEQRAPSARFFPGPWERHASETYYAEIRGKTTRGSEIVLARVGVPQGNRERAEGNADLMTAAPEMYEALRCQQDFWDALVSRGSMPGSESDAWQEKIGRLRAAALAKAEGRAK